MVLQNTREEYLFANRTYDNFVHFTLVVPITIEIFLCTQCIAQTC
jgi:hypothetical protein